MANFFGKDRDTDFAASKLMSFGKSFSRMNGQPLDESEVWYNKADLEAFAAGNSAYVGMKLVYVDEANQKVYQYSVQYDGTIKEIGTSPVGDNKSIVVDAETATVSLKGIDSLVFEREVDILGEDGEPTGEKKTEEVKYQPLMTAAGITWVEPSKTTVEGLALLIEDLTSRTVALEGSVGKAAQGETAATGLFKAIADEAARATTAEEALDDRIDELSAAVDAIDFIDTDELATALDPYAKTADVNKTLEDYAKTADVNTVLADYAKTSDMTTALAGKVDNTTYNTDKKALEDADTALDTAVKAAQKTADDATTAINDFLKGTGAEGVIDSLTEIKTALDGLVDPSELATSIANKADKVENAVEGNFAGLDANGNLVDSGKKADDFATPADVEAVENKFDDYTTTSDLTNLLAGKVDTTTYAADKADINSSIEAVATTAATDAQDKADAAKNAAISAAATDAQTKADAAKDAAIADADAKLANKANVSDVYSKSQTYSQAEVNALIDQVTGGDTSETAASVKLQLDNYKKIVNAEVWGNEEATGDSRIDKLEAVGAQANVIESVVASSTSKITATKNGKEVTIDDSALVSLISAAQNKADQGVSDAATAKSAADTAQATANTNAGNITTLSGRVESAEGNINTNASNIAGLDTRLATAEGSLKTVIETTIPSKADKSVVDGLSTTVGTHTSEIAALDTNKANKSDVYTKEQVYTKSETDSAIIAITGTPDADKTLVQMIAAAQTAATYDDTGVKADIKKNADAIAVLNGDIETTGSVVKIASDTAKAEVAAIVDSAPEAFDTLKEIAAWIAEDETATEALVERVAANETAVKTTLPAAIAQALTDAKAYADVEVAKIVADGTTIIKNSDGKFAVNQVSTDLLVQGTDTLVLNGGDAKGTNAE